VDIQNNRQALPPEAAKTAGSGQDRTVEASAQGADIRIKAAPAVVEYQPADIDKAVAELQEFVDGLGRNLSFRRDDLLDRSIITVRDASDNQVVRQIPAEEVVAIARQIRQDLSELRAGWLLDSKA